MGTSKKSSKTKKSDNQRSNILLFWKLVGVGISMVVILFLLAAWGVFGDLPDHTSLENPETELATEILTADGKTLGTFYNDNRKPIKYKDLPQHLVDALVSTEDERFFNHSGIDGYGTGRAIAFLGTRGGASTITQQLAKLYFTDQASSNIVERIIQKSREWIITGRLEKQYTKKEIISMYLNEMDFIKNAIGIRSAANIYFGKEPMDLKIEEAAVLVGMLKNPRQFNPAREISKQKSHDRRNVVLGQMYRNGKLTEREKDSLQALPLVINYTPESHNDGMATYFREYLRAELKEWTSKTINKETGKPYNLYNDGLRINTTIDYRLQKHAEDAVSAHMKNLQAEFNHQMKRNETAPFTDLEKTQIDRIIKRAMVNSVRWKELKAKGLTDEEVEKSFDQETEMTVFDWKSKNKEIDTVMTPRDSIVYYKQFLRAAMMSIEPQTGYVKTWVGGINHKYFKFDMVEKGKRQPGSTFKPFLYATAIDLLNYSPCQEFSDGEYTIPAGKWGNTKDWTPKDSSGEYGNILTITDALARSKNTISARLMDEVGPQAVIDLANRLGINTTDFEAVPSLALGTSDVNLFEMIGAYAVFANRGIYNEPVLITSIEDKNGTILYQYTPESKDVMNEETAYTTIKLMEGVTQGGSGARLRGDSEWRKKQALYQEIMTGYPYDFKNPIAGKTGTTQNNSDGWFMGMVPNLVTGVWVGGEDRAVHFSSTAYGQGASMALPIWGSFMKNAYADERLNISKEPFQKPEDLSIIVDCSEYNSSQDSDPLNEEEDTSSELDM